MPAPCSTRWTCRSTTRPGSGAARSASSRALRDRIAEIRCPVLAVAGALDFSGVVATARMLEADAPDARAVIWDDVAHMIGMEQPDRLAAEIVAFLAPLAPWA